MDNSNIHIDLTDDWEKEVTRRSTSKIKFPIKVIESDLYGVDTEFSEPKISDPKTEGKNEISKNVRVVDLSGKKKQKTKTNLF
jgi:hypothetical protein